MKLAIPALLVILSAAALPAQITGRANTNAPTITTTIEMDNGTSITLQYRSITMARGAFLKALTDEQRGAAQRQRLKDTAEGAPLGSLKTDKDIELAGKKVPAGDYKVMFTMDEELKWHMTLARETTPAAEGEEPKQEPAPIDIVLDLKDGDEERPRLTLTLMAAENANAAELKVAFGKQRGHLTVSTPGSEQREDRRGGQGGGDGQRRRRGD